MTTSNIKPRLPVVIGITGRAGAGKDTFAMFLSSSFHKRGHSSIINSFAYPLKECARTLFNLTMEQITDRTLKETKLPHHNATPRELLQQLGSAIRKQFHNKPFIELMRVRIEHTLNTSSVHVTTIVPDVRYQNEAEFILSYPDSILIVLERPGDECKTTSSSHESEAGIDVLDLKCPSRIIHFTNEGNLTDLRYLAEALAARLEGL